MDKNFLKDKKIMKLFPKTELHRHLEGTMDPKTLYKLSQKNNLNLPSDYEEFLQKIQFPKEHESDFHLFLSLFRNNYYKSYDDIYEVVYNSVKNFQKSSLHYIELRFSPEHYCLENDFDRKEVTKLIVEAGKKAAEEIDCTIKYLLTFNRGKQNQEQMIKLFESIHKMKLDDIVGVDLAGDETKYPPKLFSEFFNHVYSKKKYGITIHAGEVSDSKQIWDSIFHCYANRIGHGVSTIHDKELQCFIKDNNIVLEQCVSSNFQTGAWKDSSSHPMPELLKRGLNVTINTDDPTIQNMDLTEEYIKLNKLFDFDLDLFIKNNLLSINSAFIDKKLKEKLKKSYLKKVEFFKKSILQRV